MKAEFYFTLLDGLLATTIYHPYNHGTRMRGPFFSSPGVRGSTYTLAGSETATVTAMPGFKAMVTGDFGKDGITSSATPLCSYRLSLLE